jgi:hypothetical protein
MLRGAAFFGGRGFIHGSVGGVGETDHPDESSSRTGEGDMSTFGKSFGKAMTASSIEIVSCGRVPGAGLLTTNSGEGSGAAFFENNPVTGWNQVDLSRSSEGPASDFSTTTSSPSFFPKFMILIGRLIARLSAEDRDCLFSAPSWKKLSQLFSNFGSNELRG